MLYKNCSFTWFITLPSCSQSTLKAIEFFIYSTLLPSVDYTLCPENTQLNLRLRLIPHSFFFFFIFFLNTVDPLKFNRYVSFSNDLYGIIQSSEASQKIFLKTDKVRNEVLVVFWNTFSLLPLLLIWLEITVMPRASRTISVLWL